MAFRPVRRGNSKTPRRLSHAYSEAEMWPIVRFCVLLHIVNLTLAWIPTAATLLVYWAALQQYYQHEDQWSSSLYKTLPPNRNKRRGSRLRSRRNRLHGITSLKQSSQTALHLIPYSYRAVLTFHSWAETTVCIIQQLVSAIMAENENLLSALPGYVPPMGEGVTPGGIPVTPLQSTDSQPSQSQQYRTQQEAPSITPSPAPVLQSFFAIQPMPAPRSAEAPTFNGYNLSTFLREYIRLCKRYQVADARACDLIEDYCTEDVGPEVRQIVSRSNGSFVLLQDLLRAKYAAVDSERMLSTEGALEQFVQQAKENPYGDDLLSYSRQF
jgi:hypothetical protein